MKTLSIAALLLMLTNCAGGNVAKIKLGKKCTVGTQSRFKNPLLSGLFQKKLFKTSIKESIKNIV